MSELLREKFVNRRDRNRKVFNGSTNDPIRVSFYDGDKKRVNDVTRSEANKIAAANPGQLFYFQDKNGIQRELTIGGVNGLNPGSDLKKTSPCNTGPKPCGPPYLNIFGGQGVGAAANTVISPVSSSVIAFDIANGGKNYTSPPFAQVIDECGNGKGSKLETEISGGSVVRIKVKAPGDGYLSSPNGSSGGGGRSVSTPTIPTPIITPTIPSPTVRPVELFPKYPVVLEIEDVDIINPGFGYVPGDTIIVTPDNGAVLEPVIDNNGRIIDIKVIRPGIGFNDFPEITVDSKTGYNFSSRPIFKVIRVDEKIFVPPPGTPIISVVDCVGKIPNQIFDVVPR